MNGTNTDKMNTSNLLFVMADVLETNLMDARELLRKDGQDYRQQDKRNFNTAIHAIKCLKHEITRIPEEEQEDFGRDSDMIYQFIRLLISRCGADDMKLFKFFNYVKSFPSILDMRVDDTVFNNINQKKK